MMKNTIEREWLEQKGFIETEENFFKLTLTKTVEVVFHGEQESTLEIMVCINENAKSYLVSYYKGHRLYKRKIYSFGWSRTRNAICETVEYTGFKFREEGAA